MGVRDLVPSAHDITVAVATCGRPDGLTRCLEALAGGTARPGEVIIVDQAPTARARAAADACTGLEVRYLEQPRLGLSASRNLALASATTTVLAVTDDDCAPQQGWVAALADALRRHPVPAAVTGPVVASGPAPAGAHAVSLRTSSARVDHRGRVLPWHVGSGANFAAHMALLERHGGWDERLGVGSRGRAAEDADLLYRIMRGGGAVRYEPDAIVAHEWQTRSRRLETRTSYAFGIGALCGLWLRRGDAYAARILAGYAHLHGSELVAAVRRHDGGRAHEHARALGAIAPGMAYGLTARRRS